MARKHFLDKDEHGKELITTVFSVKKAILNILMPEEATGLTKMNRQEGFMYLFAGSQAAFRSPVAHEVMDIDAKKGSFLVTNGTINR